MILQECEEPSIRFIDHNLPASRQAAALHPTAQAAPEGSQGTLIKKTAAQDHSLQDPQQGGQVIPFQRADGKPQEGNTQSGDVQHAGQVSEMASSQHELPRPPSEQQLIHQAGDMVLDSSAPTLSGNPLCPSLNLNLFTQVAPLQLSCAAQSQIGARAESTLHQAGRTEPLEEEGGLPVVSTDVQRLREGTSVGAEATRAAEALTCIEETAREEAAPLAFSPAAQLSAEEQLRLCLRLNDTQVEAEPDAHEQAAKGSPDAGTTVIPDTREPCSSSKETPKSKQQVVPGEQPPEPALDQQDGLLAAAEGEAGKQHQDVLLQHGFTGAPGNAQQPARR